jgi:hypothetical protein
LSTSVSINRSVTFFTDRISFTALVLEAWGPPLAMAAEMSSEYILQCSRVVVYVCVMCVPGWGRGAE